MFKLLLIKEFQRLKEIESNQLNLHWDVRRILSKINYHIQTDAIKNHIVPKSRQDDFYDSLPYAEEADLINIAVFGCTAKEWRDLNPQLASDNKNIRDYATLNQLTVLSNLESINSEFIKSKVEKEVRFENLKRIAQQQLKIIESKNFFQSISKQSESNILADNNKSE